MSKKKWRDIFLSTAKLTNPGTIYWGKGQNNSLRWSKWGIVCLCKSNSSWDMTKNMKKENVKNSQFCKKLPNIGMGPIIKMFNNLEAKILKANEFWLKSLK